MRECSSSISHSASGHVLLAWQDEDTRERWFAMMIAHEPQLRRLPIEAAIDDIRAAGVATIPSQVVDGVTDISAPVMQHGRAICALTIPFIERRGSTVNMATTTRLLIEAAKEVSETLAHRSTPSLDN